MINTFLYIQLKKDIHFDKEIEKNENFENFVPKMKKIKKLEKSKNIKDINQIIVNNWSFEERESLKKSLISFGVGRWKRIREGSTFGDGQTLKRKSLEEVKAYSLSFLRCVADNLSY